MSRDVDGSVLSVVRFLVEFIGILLFTLPLLMYQLIKTFFEGEGKDVKGKVVLITGTGNGLGKELALQFARQGSRVICVDVQDENNQRTVQEIRQVTGDSRSAVGFKCDVSNTTQVEELKVKVMEEYPAGLDILVNNAGLLYCNNVLTGTDDHIRRVMDINVLGYYWMTRAFLPKMKEKSEGQVAFVASVGGLLSGSGMCAYGTSKFGVRALALSLKDEMELETNGRITVSTVYPYFINTNRELIGSIKKRVPPLSPAEAARQTIQGLRRGINHFCIPGGRLTYALFAIGSILPYDILNIYRKVVYVTPEFTIKPEEYIYIPDKSDVKVH